ncbi:MAG: ABC transporter permease [Bacteroidetes bacterium]|nr:ABC transporter permease [Bacteroidota bacterium]
MLRNYLRTAFRHLSRNKFFSLVNIMGLALGMAGAALLLLNIQYDMSVDQFHAKKDRLYKAYGRQAADGGLQCWDVTSPSLGPALKKDFPEVKQVARTQGTDHLIRYKDKMLQTGGSYADETFLDMFSFPLLKGNAATALHDAHSIVITEDLAKMIFGDEDPMNKTLLSDNKDNFTVTGVLKNLPDNTKFRFDYLISSAFVTAGGWQQTDWVNNYLATWVELQPGASMEELNKKIAGIGIRASGNKEVAEFFLHPLTREHLYGHFENGKEAGGNIDNVRFLGILAAIILLIACINFMNLSTARSGKRSREVGVRKVMGAGRSSLIGQFAGESILMAAFAGLLALLIVELLIPYFSELSRAHLQIEWRSPRFWLSAVGFVLLTGVLAGSYPAFYLSSFNPVKVLKGISIHANALVTPRKILVVTQFVLAIFLINFTIVFQKQITHGLQRLTGYEKDRLVFQSMTADLRRNYDQLKNELMGSGLVTTVSKSSTVASRKLSGTWSVEWAGKDPKTKTMFDQISAQGGFVAASGLKLLSGRDLDVDLHPSDTGACLVNRSAMQAIGFAQPIGQELRVENTRWQIVGVVEDFMIGGPNESAKPLIIQGSKWENYINIRLRDGARGSADAVAVEAILKKYNPGFITDLQYADDDYARKFRQPQNVAKLINGFAGVAIFISCLGLFGLALYMAESRTREIGIRKTLGAGVTRIVSLLASDFLRLVVIAILIATPAAWWFMSFFLKHFEYRTTVSGWIPAAAGLTAIFIAALTVSFHSLKAAMANPVESLRTE